MLCPVAMLQVSLAPGNSTEEARIPQCSENALGQCYEGNKSGAETAAMAG